MKTTLKKIREHHPCSHGWTQLLRYLNKTTADDEPLSILTVLESNGIEDALWCLRAVEGHDREIRLFAVWCARQVQHLMTDSRSIAALDVAERFARGDATDNELTAAWNASRDAAWNASRDASWAAAWAAAWAARDASWAAAGDAAGAAAGAAGAASRDASRDAAGAAAGDAARTAARDAQKAKLIEVCEELKC